ncbi:MAG: carbonic anhydrase [Simkania sp.]|nr:carbonic anhydrase [Simkania sp.]
MRCILPILGVFIASTTGILAETSQYSPKEALDMLMQGNQRYMSGKPSHSDVGSFHREELVNGQTPIAVIVSCSDSRVSPEIIFDQGLGDTFVVRLAGNVIGPLEIESILYGADALATPLIIVLGHSNCGAVKAAMTGGEAIRDIPEIAKKLAPAFKALKHLKEEHKQTPTLEEAIKTNVKYVRDQLRAIPLLAQFVEEKRLSILGGFYDLEDGKVSLLNN